MTRQVIHIITFTRLQLRIFPGISPGLLDRIFLCIQCQFGKDDFLYVQVIFVCHKECVGKYVSQLLPDFLDLNVLRILPQERFVQLRRLDGQGEGQVLAVVKLIPVPFVSETGDFLHYFGYI